MILTFFSADKYGIKSDMFASIQREWATLEKVFKAYTASLNGAKFSISDFNTALAQSKAKAEQEGEAVEGLTLKMVALRAGAMLLNVALNAIVSTVANFVITKFNEWRTAIETNAQKSKELSSSMTDLISQYKELGDKSGWDTDDFAQAKDLNAEILDLLKNQSAEMDEKLRKLDLENGKYQEQIDLLNELSISTLTQNKADQGKLLEQTAKGKSSGQYVIGDSSDTDMANALGGKFGGSLDSNTGVFNFGGFDPNDADSILAYYDKLSNALDYLGSNYDSATLEASSLYNQLKSEKNAIEDQANAYRSSSDTLKEVIAAQKLSSTSSKRSEEDIKAVIDALEGLKGAYGGVTSGNLVSFLNGDKKLGGTYADALNQLKEVMLNLGFEDNTSDAQAFVDVLVQLGIVSSSSASKVDGLSESTSAAADQLKEATDGLDKIQSAYSTLSDVVDEYNENGYLTVSTLTDLINLGPEYYDCLVNESGQLAINTENINTMADAYYEMAKAALYAQAIESLNANTNTYANASKFLSQAQQEVKDMKSLLYTEGQRLIDEGGLSGDALTTQVQAQQRIINTYSAMMDLLDKTHAQSAENQFRNPKDKNSNKSSGSKDNEDKMTDAVSAWKTLSAAMEEYNQYGNLCISTLNDLLGLEDDYTSLLTEQNAAASHTHNYAGSGTAGGSANSAIKLDSSAGSATRPVYFSGGKPVAIGYTIAKSVPADAKFTDTNTWRGIQNNLTSDSTDQSLSAAQGKALKTLVDGKAPASHKHTKSQITDFPTSMPASDVSAWAKAATKPSYTKAEVGLSNVDNTADKNKNVKFATSAGSATNAQCLNNDSQYMRFHWNGQSGQPSWLWGGSDASNMYVYNPSNFSVNYANSAGTTLDAPYTITYEGTYTGTGEYTGSASLPIRHTLSKSYDLVYFIKNLKGRYTPGLIDLFSQGNYGKQYVAMNMLPTTFTLITDLSPNIITMYNGGSNTSTSGQWANRNYIRRNGNSIEFYSTYSSNNADYFFNDKYTSYYIFGFNLNHSLFHYDV